MAPPPGQARLAPIRKLKVAFCIPHSCVTGGLKMLLEQIRLLRQRGHHVVALMRSELAASAVPPWSDVEVDEDVVVRLTQRFRAAYDVDSCDAIVTGIFHQVPEWLTSTSAPVLYYEQGHEWLFGDPLRFLEEGRYAAQDNLFHQTMHLPVALAAVSEAVQTIISKEFARSCLLVHNGVDSQSFCPGPRDDALLAAPARHLAPAGTQPDDASQLPSVLLVGNPALSLKGFDCALAALALVQRSRPIQVHWVCQQEPPEALLAAIESDGLTVSLHVNPPQGDLPRYYRGHDCFLFTSQYEAWGMPVLEAMASGLPVVATATGGVTSFATPSVDCLLAPPGRHAELAQHVLSVLGDAALAARLAAAARNTAGAYTAERVVGQLERALYCLTACRQELLALRLQALPDAQLAAGAAVKACSGAVAAHKAALRARQRAASAATAGVVSALAVTSEAEQRHRKGKACECCTVLPPAQANGAATAERTSQDEQQVPEQQQEQHALDNPARQQQREQQQQVPHNECRPAAEQAGAAPETRQHPLQRRRYSGDAKRQRRSLDTPPQSPTAKEAEGEGGKSEALYTLRSARQL
ncbi:glycosyl transferase group 1 [Micractinium conductrix]|uniref:Glycosyl transferase group 1 n=1 Tax=Micractinium conductrix TaxID=554055 RepID=A0A2P6V9W0_9CHLO|nr:glycosyl transferase group 1 [Micractinium conductrix]|eukprot:PSC70858.1 glycosyl transferase group 1 [Micractinium conductrix]